MAGFTTVEASFCRDATGKLVANATITFQPCNNQGIPLSFLVQSVPFGQTMSLPVSATVTAGAFTVQLADTTLTQPVNIAYAVTITDNVTGKSLLGPGYLIQPSGATWDFDLFVPNLPALTTIQTGPTGPTGPPNSLAVGTVTTGASGSAAAATITGAAPNQTLNLTIPQGPVGGVMSLAQQATQRGALPGTVNLFNPAAVTAGFFLNGAPGTLVANSSFSVSGFIVANSGGSMVASVPFATGTAGYAFYDQTQTFISGSATAVAAGTPIAIPANAAYVRLSVTNSAVATAMVVNGTTLPSSFVSFQLIDAYTGAYNLLAANNVANAAHYNAVNLFNPAAATAGTALQSSGTTSALLNNTTSDFMPVAGFASIISSVALSNSGGFAACWFDLNKNFISALPTTAAATAIAVPSNAAYIRTFWNSSNNATAMVVNGTTLPASYLPYNLNTFINNSVVSMAASVVDQGLQQKLSSFYNLYNPVSPSLTVGALTTTGTINTTITADVVSDFMPVAGLSNVVLSAGISGSGGFGPCWFDANKNFISVIGPNGAFTPGAAIPVPAGAVYLRISTGAFTPGAGVPQMVIAGSTLPAGYVPFYTGSDTVAQNLSAERQIGFWGDSITATFGFWQSAVLMRTGFAKGFQDAVNGRGTVAALDHYSNNTPTGINTGAGANNTGTLGNTLTQDIAGLSAMLIWEGTDDNPVASTNLGSPASTAWDGSEYGNIKGLIETLQAANPAMRIFWVGPYFQTTQADPYNTNIRAAIAYQCQAHGVPFLDMVQVSGINTQNLAVALQTDTIHPLSSYCAFTLGPLIANWIKSYF